MCGVGEYSNTLIYCTLPRAVFSAAHRLTSEMFTVAMEKKQNILSQEIVSWAIALIVIDSRCKSSFWPSHWWLCLFLATIQIQCICCRCEVPIVRSRQLESSHVLHLYQLCHNIWARSLEVLCVNVMASPPPPSSYQRTITNIDSFTAPGATLSEVNCCSSALLSAMTESSHLSCVSQPISILSTCAPLGKKKAS